MSTRFRSSFTSKEGHDPARIVQGYVTDVNLVLWTVNIVGRFDRVRYYNIQVSSTYLHYTNGEGFYVMPEVGARVMVCIPSDSSPPFVLCFLMPHELIDDSSQDAPQGTQSRGQPSVNTTDASFRAGRPAINPGDQVWRGRDGNFVILHRGGVLSVGATELSQRMYFPLNNLIVDISENYQHNNTAGSINWGIQEGPSTSQYPSFFTQTFRVFANDKFADVRLSCGKFSPLGDPDGGTLASGAGVGTDANNPIIYELAVSPKGFVAETGAPASSGTVGASVFRFAFDRAGNTLLRMSGNVVVQSAKTVTLKVGGDFSLQSQGNFSVTSVNGADLDGGTYSHIKGNLVRLGAGQTPVARKGDAVSTSLIACAVTIQLAQTPVAGVPIPATITTIQPMLGSIVGGNPAVLA